MATHPAIIRVIERLDAAEIHAARSGVEVFHALATVAADSRATSAVELSDEIDAAIDQVLEALPPYGPPLTAIGLVVSRIEESVAHGTALTDIRTTISSDATAFERRCSNAQVGLRNHAAAMVPEGATVLTFTFSETMLGVLTHAMNDRRLSLVLLTESRPNDDGLAAAKKLSMAGLRVGVSVDACVALLLPQADLVLMGAEAVQPDGSIIGKVGSYALALVARTHGVPLFVVVDGTKFVGIKLDAAPCEKYALGTMPAAFTNSAVSHVRRGRLFEETPADLITGFITERGVVSTASCTALTGRFPMTDSLRGKLSHWAHRSVPRIVPAGEGAGRPYNARGA